MSRDPEVRILAVLTGRAPWRSALESSSTNGRARRVSVCLCRGSSPLANGQHARPRPFVMARPGSCSQKRWRGPAAAASPSPAAVRRRRRRTGGRCGGGWKGTAEHRCSGHDEDGVRLRVIPSNSALEFVTSHTRAVSWTSRSSHTSPDH